jgi:hypothetical protein
MIPKAGHLTFEQDWILGTKLTSSFWGFVLMPRKPSKLKVNLSEFFDYPFHAFVVYCSFL